MKRLCMILVIIMLAGFASAIFGKDAVMPVIIDVRTTKEFIKGHLDGAMLLPYDVIGEKIGSVVKDKSQKIFLYCRTGRRSNIAKQAIEKLGYKNIVDLGSMENAAKILNRSIVTK